MDGTDYAIHLKSAFARLGVQTHHFPVLGVGNATYYDKVFPLQRDTKLIQLAFIAPDGGYEGAFARLGVQTHHFPVLGVGNVTYYDKVFPLQRDTKLIQVTYIAPDGGYESAFARLLICSFTRITFT